MFWQIIIQDDDNLSGRSVGGVVTDLLKTIPYMFVRIFGFEGAANRDQWISLEKEGLIEVSRFLQELKLVVQVDWGTFCFTKEAAAFPQEQSYLERSLPSDETVVRCVDGEYLYLYTNSNELSLFLQKNYRCLSAKQVDYGGIEWPE